MSYLLHIDATSFDAEPISRRIARSFLDQVIIFGRTYSLPKRPPPTA
jgi:hypothetical protein